MKIEEVAAKKSRAHTRYKLADGTLVPGVTTVLGVLNKPALVPWANKLGLAGINVGQYVDTLAEIGQLGHAMILAHLEGTKPDLSEYSKNLIDKAENCLLSYFEWEKQHKLEPRCCEIPLVSHLYKFGGTPDFNGLVDGIPTLLDFKTGRAIYDEYFYQLAAYRQLIVENELNVDMFPLRGIILQIGRDETEGFSTKEVKTWSREWEIFKACLRIYELKREKK